MTVYASGQYGDLEPAGLKAAGNDTLLWPHCSGISFFNAANPPQYDKIAIVVPKGNEHLSELKMNAEWYWTHYFLERNNFLNPLMNKNKTWSVEVFDDVDLLIDKAT